MAKYYTYQGKQVGFVRKMVDDVILIEDAWVNEVRVHLARNGYDGMLSMVAKILSAGGHKPVTRAQAWIILKELLKDEIPDVLQNKEADEIRRQMDICCGLGLSEEATAAHNRFNPFHE